jgi:glycine dehydrogenase subunit 1
MRFDAPFFNEFVIQVPEAEERWRELAQSIGLVAGYPIERWYPELADCLLLCVTEVHTPEQIDALVRELAPAGRAKRAGAA